MIERVKDLEHQGYQYEAADGSFELLLRQEAGDYEPLFRLESWRVIVEQRADGKVETEATVKVWLDGERYVQTAEGNGPVNALDAALRAAIVQVHPHLASVSLVNFKVRILDEAHGTDAVTRVFIDASDGTVGLGLDGRARERDRRVVAGAGRLARVRRAGRSPRPEGSRSLAELARGSFCGVVAMTADLDVIPIAKPVIGPEEEARSSRCCGPGTCRSARACRSSSGCSPSTSARRARQRGVDGTPRCIWRCARSG